MDAAIEVAPAFFGYVLPLPMKWINVNVYAFDEGDSWTIFDRLCVEKVQASVDGLIAGRPQAGGRR